MQEAQQRSLWLAGNHRVFSNHGTETYPQVPRSTGGQGVAEEITHEPSSGSQAQVKSSVQQKSLYSDKQAQVKAYL